MKKTLLLAGVLSACSCLTMHAQVVSSSNDKWDAQVERLMLESKQTRSASDVAHELIISSTNPQLVADELKSLGFDAEAVGSRTLTATLPVAQISLLAAMDEVSYIQTPRVFRPLMNTTREAIRVDEIHAGSELETPFTGKGVIVGVIDQSFEYKHIAFQKDGKSRLIGVWNRGTQKLVTNVPATGDGMTASMGHATHVANIAAGSKVAGVDFHGVAPDADLVFVPSAFSENEIIKSTKAIHDLAKKEGKPYVINMSFGSQLGPHDGSTTYDQAMTEYSIDGGILVAAMGNEGGEKLHASYTFEKDGETKYVIFELPYEGQDYNVIDLWGTNANGKQNLKVRPLVFNKITKAKDFKNATFWTGCGSMNVNIDSNNKKEHYYYQMYAQKVTGGNSSMRFALEITGNTGDGFHLWVNPTYGSVATNVIGSSYIKGDNTYCVGEGAGCIPRAIAVASFNGNDGTFISAQDNREYDYRYTQGAISSFSSVGPWLGEGDKPTIAAPGAVVSSAFNRFDGDFSAGALEVTKIVQKGSSKYYYGVMSGTSMATPAVSGVMALWLEANPQLDYEDVVNIFKETAVRDRQTGTTTDWDAKFGFGKIDAYAGLKKALEMAEGTGLEEVHNSVEPVTLNKTAEAWYILFNNDESFANITVCDMGGKVVYRQQLNDVRRGNETIVSLNALPSGVYLINITTTLGTITRKVMVD